MSRTKFFKVMKPMTFKELIIQVRKGNWIIKKVHYSRFSNKCRIDAETRFYRRGENNFFSEWCSENYINQLRKEEGLKPIREVFPNY